MADAAISIQGVSKEFRSRGRTTTALDGVTLDLSQGEFAVLTGANGAGKTTLLKIAAGLVLPDRGDISVMGYPAGTAAARRLVGFAPSGERTLFWRLSVEHNLSFFAALRGLAPRAARAETERVLGLCGLAPHRARLVGECSAGIRQRASLARALLGEPAVLLADEPTQGLDGASAGAFWEVLRAAADRGAAVVVATHRIDEARPLADAVVALEGGRIADVERTGRRKEAATSAPPLARAAGTLFHRSLAVARKDARLQFGTRWAWGVKLARTALILTSFYFVSRLVGSSAALASYAGGYFPFVLVWISFQAVQTAALSVFVTEVRGGQLTGVLEALAVSPAPLLQTLSFSAAWRLLIATVEGAVCFGLGQLLFGASFSASLHSWGAVLTALFLMSLFLGGLGLASAGLVLVWGVGTPLVSAYGALSSLLGGALYPVAVLPEFLRGLSVFFPLTLFLRVARGALLGGNVEAADLAALGAWGILGAAVGWWGFQKGLSAARRRAALGNY